MENKFKEYRLKHNDSDYYLIPVELVDDFNKRVDKIDFFIEYSENWYVQIDMFNNQFSRYKIEGNLFDLQLYLKEQ